MVQVFCKLCLQSLPHTEWKFHIAQKQHLQQLPLKIVVKGPLLRDKVDELYAYFINFGGIRSQDVAQDGNKISVEYRFWDARIHSEIIHQEHRIFDQEIEISWYKKDRTGSLEYVEQDERMRQEKFVYRKLTLLNEIKLLSTFSEQLTLLQNKLENVQKEMKTYRQRVYTDLTTTLSPNFRHSKIHFFGSTITELYLYDSDLNIYIDNTDGRNSTLELMRNLLTKCEHFRDVTLDESRIKCRHKLTQVSCKIDVKSELPVGNSELVKYYLTLDEKLKLLTLLVKFWADCHGFREVFGGYALCLMVVFYLQHAYNLPSVQDLQKDLPVDEVDGCNCAFGPVEFSSSLLQSTTMLELLSGFFRFYGGFDYEHHVVTPFLGSIVEKKQQVDGFFIQDPFEHSRSVAPATLSRSGEFTAACRHSSELLFSNNTHNLFVFSHDAKFYLRKDKQRDQDWICALLVISEKILKECGCEVEDTPNAAEVVYSCKDTSMKVTLRFEVPLGVSFFFEKEGGSEMVFHAMHLFYVKLVGFLEDKTFAKRVEKSPEMLKTIEKILQERQIKVEVKNEEECAVELLSSDDEVVEILDVPKQELIDLTVENHSLVDCKNIPAEDKTTEEISDGTLFSSSFLPFFQDVMKATTLSDQSAILSNIPKQKPTDRDTVSKDLSTLPDFKFEFVDFLDYPPIYEIYVESKCDLKVLRQHSKFAEIILGEFSLKSRHISTDSLCVFYFAKPRLSTTNLLKYYLNEKNFRLLTIFVELWAHHFFADGFNSYSLYLMIVFSLQQKPFYFPSVAQLQEKISATLKNYPLQELVKHFFSFYAHFDYTKYVVCTYCGSEVEKVSFLEPYKNLPGVYKSFKDEKKELEMHSGICVQDPLEHGSNVTDSISLEISGKFSALCRIAAGLKISNLTPLLSLEVEKCNSFQIEKQKDVSWRSVQRYMSYILTKILGCLVTLTKTGYDCKVPMGIWNNRVHVLKTLGPWNEDEEAAVTNSIIKNSRTVVYDNMKLDLIYSDSSTIKITIHCENGGLHLLHVIYTKLQKIKTTDSHCPEDRHVSEQFEKTKRYILDRVNTGSNFTEQTSILVTALDEQKDLLETQSILVCKDLWSALDQKVTLVGSPVSNPNIYKRCLEIYIEIDSSKKQTKSLLIPLLKNSRKFNGVQQRSLDVVQCNHVQTCLLCVINTAGTNKFVESSEQVKTYANLDVKVHQLMTVVRFWAGMHASSFSKYVLDLMVIFYLQQIYKTPPMSEVQSVTVFDNVTIFALVKGFFKFYGDFDYFTYIISPSTGRALEKASCSIRNARPWLTIEDPLMVDSNIVDSNTDHFSGKFTSNCREAANIMTETNLNLFLTHSYNDFACFEIRNCNLDTYSWQKEVTRVFLKITKGLMRNNVLSNGDNIYAVEYSYSSYSPLFISSVLKEIAKLPGDATEWEKDTLMVPYVLEKQRPTVLRIELSFEDPSKIVLKVQTISEFGYQYTHFLYTRMKKYLLKQVNGVVVPTLHLEKETKEVEEANQKEVHETTFEDFKRHIIAKTNIDRLFPIQISILINIIDRRKFLVETKSALLCNDLTSILSPINPQITVFGSTVTNLITYNTSLDIYMDIEKNTTQAIKYLEESQKFTEFELSGCVLKCRHVETKLPCLIHTKEKTRLVDGTALIKNFVRLHVKVRQLMLFLRFWVDCRAGIRIWKHILDLLVIFYLQQEPYKLPPLDKLSEEPVELSALEGASIYTLLRGFFRFYGNFDYFRYIISPRSGCVVEKGRGLLQITRPWLTVESPVTAYGNIDNSLHENSGIMVSKFRKAEYDLRHTTKKKNVIRTLLVSPYEHTSYFQILYDSNIRNVRSWQNKVLAVFVQIMKELLGSEVCNFQYRYSGFIYKVTHFKVQTHDHRNSLQKLIDLPESATEWERDKVLMAYVLGKGHANPQVIRVSFVQRPTRIQFHFQNANSFFHQYLHIVYTRMMKFFSNNKDVAFVQSDKNEGGKKKDTECGNEKSIQEDGGEIPPKLSQHVIEISEDGAVEDDSLDCSNLETEETNHGTCAIEDALETNSEELKGFEEIKDSSKEVSCENEAGALETEADDPTEEQENFVENDNAVLTDKHENSLEKDNSAPIEKLANSFDNEYSILSEKHESSLESGNTFTIEKDENYLGKDDLVATEKSENSSRNEYTVPTEKYENSLENDNTLPIEKYENFLENGNAYPTENHENSVENDNAHPTEKHENSSENDNTLPSRKDENSLERNNSAPTEEHENFSENVNAAEKPEEKIEACQIQEEEVTIMESDSPSPSVSQTSFPTFEKQAFDFVRSFQSAQKHKIKAVEADVVSAFEHKVKHYEFFGSIITGLETEAVHVYVELEGSELASEIQTFHKLNALLISQPCKFIHKSTAPRRRYTFTHLETETPVIIYCRDDFGIHNTRLFKYYLNLDDKVLASMIIVKTWVDRQKSLKEFSLYILANLMIFFLQQVYKLPSVVSLQRGTSAHMIDGWNCAFMERENIMKDMTVFKIVGGFFKYFGDFDYFSFVIAPFFGSPIAKTRFLFPFTLPEAYGSYIQRRCTLSVDHGMCIQDPFVHSNNISNFVTYHSASIFADCCRRATKILQENLLDKLLIPQPTKVSEFTITRPDDENEENWIETVKNVFRATLSKIFGGTTDSRFLGNDDKEQHCYFIPGNILHGRIEVLKKVLKQLHRGTSAIEKEIAVTSHMTQNLKHTHRIELVVTAHFEKDHLKVAIPGNYMDHACHFLYTRLVKFLNCKSSRATFVTKRRSDDASVPSKKPKLEASTSQSTGEKSMNISLNGSEKKKISVPKPSLASRNSKQTILNNTRSIFNFTEQVSQFCKLLVDPKIVQKTHNLVHDDLLSVLTTRFTFDKIHFFGSSVTGLFVSDSDFNIFVDNLQQKTSETLMRALTQSLSEGNKFSVTFTATTLVKFKHNESGIECCLHFLTRLAVCNTLLIEYYLTLDPKLRQFLFLIKSWSDYRKQLSNHVLYLMVIFYLQQPPYNLPSVADLQKNVPDDIIDGCNAAFAPINFQSQALKKVTIKNLIVGFFTFYANFDYFSYVIAPFFGSVIAKIRFCHPIDLPLCYQHSKKSKFVFVDLSIFVQDPFEHCKNIAAEVTHEGVAQFAASCRNALEVFKSTEKGLLYRWMSQCQNDSIMRPFEITNGKGLETRSWFLKVKNAVLIVLTKIMCCTVIEVQEKKRGRELDQIVVKCSGLRNMWDHRIDILRAGRKDLPPEASQFDQDVFVSRVIMNDQRRIANWCVNVEVKFIKNPVFVRITMHVQNKPHLMHFFYTRVLMALENDVKEVETSANITYRQLTKARGSLSEPYKILVTGFFGSNDVLSVHAYFLKFGKITNVKIVGEDRKLAIEYCFEALSVYLTVIQKEHSCFGRPLKIIPLAPLKDNVSYAKFEDPKLAAIHQVIPPPTFAEQLNALWDHFNSYSVKLNIKKHRKEIEDDFNTVLYVKYTKTMVSFEQNIVDFVFEYDNYDLYIDNVVPERISDMKDLISKSEKFQDVVQVSEAIRCIHVNTQTCCYLRTKSKVVEATNKLLKYYLRLDKKLQKLVVMIKFWMNYHDFVGGDSFSNRAVLLLVIFYLQQEPYCLPSVRKLQENTTAEEVEGCNVAYSEIVDFKSPNLEQATILELVTGFFRFYGKFDYISYTISPYFGSPVPKNTFLQRQTLPGYSKELDVTSGICIQDFFKHCTNISLVSLDTVGSFTNLCRRSLTLLQTDEKLLLYKLFLNSHSFVCDYPEFMIDKKDDRDDEEWIQTVKTLTVTILTDVLFYKLSHIPVSGSERDSYGCVGQFNVWERRLEGEKLLALNSRGIEDEIAITKEVIRLFPEEVSWKLFVDLIFLKEPCRVKVVFVKKPGCFNVFHVCHFLYTRLVRFLDGKDEKKIEDCETMVPTITTEAIDLTEEGNKSSHIAEEVTNCKELVEERSSMITEEVATDLKQHEEGEIKNKEEEETNTKNLQQERSIASSVTKDNGDEEETNIKKVPEKRSKSGEEEEKLPREAASSFEDKHSNTKSPNRQQSEEEEEDIPSDFFDDFANEDFLDGLDILDAWDKDLLKKTATEESVEKSTNQSPKKSGKVPTPTRRRSRSRPRDRREDRFAKKRRRSTDIERPPTSPRKRKRCRRRYKRSINRSKLRNSGSSSDSSLQTKKLLEEVKAKINEVKPVCGSYTPVPSYMFSPELPVPPMPFLTGQTCTNFVMEASLAPNPAFPGQQHSGLKSVGNFLTNLANEAPAKQDHDSGYMQRKVKLLSRCYDILNILSDSHKFTVKPSPALKPRRLYQSPIKKKSVVRFSFTSPPKHLPEDQFLESLNKILQRIGSVINFQEKPVDLVDSVANALRKCPSRNKETIKNILEKTLLGVTSESRRKKSDANTQCGVVTNNVKTQVMKKINM